METPGNSLSKVLDRHLYYKQELMKCTRGRNEYQYQGHRHKLLKTSKFQLSRHKTNKNNIVRNVVVVEELIKQG